MYLLYQVQNQHIPIVLITRHQYDLDKTLQRLNIDPHLFTTIHHLTDRSPKSTIVAQYSQPIFIDDSFIERDNVLQEIGCPVFDVTAIEGLINWQA